MSLRLLLLHSLMVGGGGPDHSQAPPVMGLLDKHTCQVQTRYFTKVATHLISDHISKPSVTVFVPQALSLLIGRDTPLTTKRDTAFKLFCSSLDDIVNFSSCFPITEVEVGYNPHMLRPANV